MERLNLLVSDGTGALLTVLAGGERKRGAWLSETARAMTENQAKVMGSEIQTLSYAVAGLSGAIKSHESRLLALERLEGEVEGLLSQVAAMISLNAGR